MDFDLRDLFLTATGHFDHQFNYFPIESYTRPNDHDFLDLYHPGLCRNQPRCHRRRQQFQHFAGSQHRKSMGRFGG